MTIVATTKQRSQKNAVLKQWHGTRGFPRKLQQQYEGEFDISKPWSQKHIKFKELARKGWENRCVLSASRPFDFLALGRLGRDLLQGRIPGAVMHLVLRTFVIEHSKGLEAKDQGAVRFPQISSSTSLSNYLTVPCLSFLIGERGWTMPIAGSNDVVKALSAQLDHITDSSVQGTIIVFHPSHFDSMMTHLQSPLQMPQNTSINGNNKYSFSLHGKCGAEHPNRHF